MQRQDQLNVQIMQTLQQLTSSTAHGAPSPVHPPLGHAPASLPSGMMPALPAPSMTAPPATQLQDPELMALRQELSTALSQQLEQALTPLQQMLAPINQTHRLQQEAMQRQQAEQMYEYLGKGNGQQAAVAPILMDADFSAITRQDFNRRYAEAVQAYGNPHLVDPVEIARAVQQSWDARLGNYVKRSVTPAGQPAGAFAALPGGAPTAGAPATGPLLMQREPQSVEDAHRMLTTLRAQVQAPPQPAAA